jgi:hypothetical protein
MSTSQPPPVSLYHLQELITPVSKIEQSNREHLLKDIRLQAQTQIQGLIMNSAKKRLLWKMLRQIAADDQALAPTLVDSNSASSFPRFNELPFEIRQMVWSSAKPHRVLEIFFNSLLPASHPTVTRKAIHASIFDLRLVCNESCEAIEAGYTSVRRDRVGGPVPKGTQKPGRCIMIDMKQDTLFLNSANARRVVDAWTLGKIPVSPGLRQILSTGPLNEFANLRSLALNSDFILDWLENRNTGGGYAKHTLGWLPRFRALEELKVVMPASSDNKYQGHDLLFVDYNQLNSDETYKQHLETQTNINMIIQLWSDALSDDVNLKDLAYLKNVELRFVLSKRINPPVLLSDRLQTVVDRLSADAAARGSGDQVLMSGR